MGIKNQTRLERYQSQLVELLDERVQLNDPAHRWEHFDGVLECALILNKEVEVPYHPLAIMLVAYCHDMFAWDRPVHHDRSADWLIATDDSLIKEIMTVVANECEHWDDVDVARGQIALACRQHRASFKGEFGSEFAEMMNSADYEVPATLAPIFARAYEYARAKNPSGTDEEWYATTAQHMREKFSRSGYAKYPPMYMGVFRDEIESIWDEIDAL